MPFTPSGYEPETLEQIIDDINAIFINVFGESFNGNSSSPTGQFIYQLALIAQQNDNFMVELTASLYNPNVNSSVWLDAICALSGIVRSAATYSTVTCICSGSNGTVIPAGVLISSTNGDIFINSATVTISGGTASAIFTAQQSGAIPVLANTLTNIVNQVYGWDSVTNPTNGITGSSSQSDNSLRAVRNKLLYTQGSASVDALYANLVKLIGTSNSQYVWVNENNTSAPITINGVTLIANSIYVIIYTGVSPASIAETIFNKKPPGIGQNGTLQYTYISPNGTSFDAYWTVPALTPLQVDISVTNYSYYPPDIIVKIQDAIVNNFNGVDINVPTALPVGINETVNVSRFISSLLAINVWDIQDLTIQTVVSGTPAPSILLPADQLPTLTQANVNVTLI